MEWLFFPLAIAVALGGGYGLVVALRTYEGRKLVRRIEQYIKENT